VSQARPSLAIWAKQTLPNFEIPAMENYVFVIDTNKKPLNPVHPARARELLTQGKAAVFRTYPFVIILRHAVDDQITPEWKLKIDPGSKISGLALVKNNEVFWGLHLEHRGGLISKSLEQRAKVRRNRRSKKTRYRKPGLPNQKKPEKWLAPSLLHRVQTTETWVNRILKYVPVCCIYVEKVKFDLQKMQNPEISGVLYQQGELQGYRVREYLLEKWGRQCTYCGKKDVPLQVEHIDPKAKGGSDRISNLCLSCEKCNQKKGTQNIKDFLKNKPEILSSVLNQAKSPLKDAAAVNATRNRIVEMLETKPLTVVTGEGCQTKMNRINSVLPKHHFLDAACVSNRLIKVVSRITKPLIAICKGQGGRQKAALNKYGYPIRHNPLKPIKGWSSGDIAKRVDTGEFGRVNPRSQSNSFNFTPLGGKAVSVHMDKLKRVHRKDGYTYSFCRDVSKDVQKNAA
jgi:5-methylcytosine-specific restriction endonuclease McrA